MPTDRVNNGPMTPPVLSPLATPTADVQQARVKKPNPAAATPAAGDDAAKKNYDVQISPDAKPRAEAMQKAFGIAKNTPDIREDRVAALKKQIDEGTYQMDSGKIADGMLLEAIKDHLAQRER